jgi:hypothetical protein
MHQGTFLPSLMHQNHSQCLLWIRKGRKGPMCTREAKMWSGYVSASDALTHWCTDIPWSHFSFSGTLDLSWCTAQYFTYGQLRKQLRKQLKLNSNSTQTQLNSILCSTTQLRWNAHTLHCVISRKLLWETQKLGSLNCFLILEVAANQVWQNWKYYNKLKTITQFNNLPHNDIIILKKQKATLYQKHHVHFCCF